MHKRPECCPQMEAFSSPNCALENKNRGKQSERLMQRQDCSRLLEIPMSSNMGKVIGLLMLDGSRHQIL